MNTQWKSLYNKDDFGRYIWDLAFHLPPTSDRILPHSVLCDKNSFLFSFSKLVVCWEQGLYECIMWHFLLWVLICIGIARILYDLSAFIQQETIIKGKCTYLFLTKTSLQVSLGHLYRFPPSGVFQTSWGYFSISSEAGDYRVPSGSPLTYLIHIHWEVWSSIAKVLHRRTP